MEITVKSPEIVELTTAIKELITLLRGNQPGAVSGTVTQAVPVGATAQLTTATPPQQQPAVQGYPAHTYQQPAAPQQTVPQPPTMPQLPPGQPIQTAVPTTAVAQEYTQDQIAVAMSSLVDGSPNGYGIVSGIMQAFGVQSLTEVPQQQYPALVLKLREAGANI